LEGVQRGSVGNFIPLFEILPLLEKKMKFSSVFSGLLVAAASTLATHAGWSSGVVWSGPINVEVTQASPYTMTITEGASTFSWLITNTGTTSTFSPAHYTAGVAVLQAVPEYATCFEYGSSIDGGLWYTAYPEIVYLRQFNYPESTGNFNAPGCDQIEMYAGFSFVGPYGNYFGWLSLSMGGNGRPGSSLVVNSWAYNFGPIGAGMTTPAPGVPAPGAIALLGLVGLVGGRRRA
jgi:MYXO-CTERM domain-containing protein